jgi:sulfate/thiosulfate transport system substrate-binding protein
MSVGKEITGRLRRHLKSRASRLRRSPGISIAALPLLLLVILGVAACGGTSDSSGSGGSLSLIAYSTPQEAYEEIIPAFKKTADGKDIGFKQSYGASGDQARAVEAGLKADVVALSLAPDVDKLVEAGKVAKDWNKDSSDGFVTNSVVVLATRKGNPKNIRTWDDLLQDGVEVITPNPFTSGGAKWNIMAAYGAQLKAGKSEQEAKQFLKDLFDNVPVQDKSAREALQTFVGGKGDVLLAYENEAITAQQKGEEVDYEIPDGTILIQNPIAVTTDSKNPAKAKAFVDFTRGDEAQKIFGEKGYRSVNKDLVDTSKYPPPKNLFTIDDLGGWPAVNKEFFDPENSVMASINSDQGFPTEK